MERIKKKDRHQRSKESACIVAATLKPKGFTSICFIRRRCNKRIMRRRSRTRAKTVQHSRTRHAAGRATI